MGGLPGRGGDRIADEILDLLTKHAAEGTPCVLATVVRCEAPTSARPGDRAVITADGHFVGWVGGSCSEPAVKREAMRALAEGTPRLVRIIGGVDEVKHSRRRGEVTMATTCPSGGSLDIFIEPRLPKPTLVVFGASPAARALVRLAGITGLRTCAVHPGARPDDFEGADLVLAELDLSGSGAEPGAWAVIASMGHYDEDAIEAALAHPGLEVALVASRRRFAAVLEELRRRGVAESDLERVHSPGGRVRGASQEEVALFVLAEVAAARHRRKPATESPAAATAAVPEFALDPVCGMTVELPARHSSTHGGVTYCFCCAGCKASFDAEPQRYLKQPQPA